MPTFLEPPIQEEESNDIDQDALDPLVDALDDNEDTEQDDAEQQPSNTSIEDLVDKYKELKKDSASKPTEPDQPTPEVGSEGAELAETGAETGLESSGLAGAESGLEAGAELGAEASSLGGAAAAEGLATGAGAAEAGALGAAATGAAAAEGATAVGGLAAAGAEAATGVGIPLAVISAAVTLTPMVIDWVKKHWQLVAIILIVIESPLILLSVAIASSLAKTGDPAGGVAVGPDSLETATGGSCEGMTDRLNYVKNGITYSLGLSATQGRWSAEDSAVSPGELTTGGDLAFKSSNFTDQQLKFYVTARWPSFEYSFNGHDISAKNPPNTNTNSEYAGKEIIIYDQKTKLAAVGIIAESGPAPDTGTDHTIDSSGAWVPDSEKATQQAALWGSSYHAVAPTGYDGNVVGGPKDEGSNTGGSLTDGLGAVLKAQPGDEMTYGFATTQTLPLGLLGGSGTCTPQQAASNSVSPGLSPALSPAISPVLNALTGK